MGDTGSLRSDNRSSSGAGTMGRLMAVEPSTQITIYAQSARPSLHLQVDKHQFPLCRSGGALAVDRDE